MFEALSCKRKMIARRTFFIKNYSIQPPFEMHKQIFQSPSATPEISREMKQSLTVKVLEERSHLLTYFS